MELNLENTIEKYVRTLYFIHKSMSDVTATYDNNSKGNSEYLLIPYTEKGKKYLKFNVTNLKNNKSSVIFMGSETVSFIQYDSDHNLQYNYSISKKDDMQFIQINYADGTGLRKIYQKDSQTNTFILVETEETVKANEVMDISGYRDPIINNDLLLHFSFVNKTDISSVCLFISYGKKDGGLYVQNEHPELSNINHIMELSHMQLLDNFIDTLQIMEPRQFYGDLSKFRKTFRAFLNSNPNKVSDDPKKSTLDLDNEDR